jgi:hypothetical protein
MWRASSSVHRFAISRFLRPGWGGRNERRRNRTTAVPERPISELETRRPLLVARLRDRAQATRRVRAKDLEVVALGVRIWRHPEDRLHRASDTKPLDSNPRQGSRQLGWRMPPQTIFRSFDRAEAVRLHTDRSFFVDQPPSAQPSGVSNAHFVRTRLPSAPRTTQFGGGVHQSG